MKTVRSVLVVDDSEADLFLAQHYLESSGLYRTILTAEDGREALELFTHPERSVERYGEGFPPVLLLLDINMPRLNGFEFLEGVKDIESFRESVVVVMVTSSTFDGDLSRAKKYDCVVGYVVKPISAEKVAELAQAHGT